jgi:carboxymethylenebutenolidase
MGGRASYFADSIVPLRCAISFYGGGIASNLGRAAQLHAPMLFFWGGRDKNITPEQTVSVDAALREAGKQFVHVEFSDAGHGFFCDRRKSYNKDAAAQAWSLLQEFLRANLTGA